MKIASEVLSLLKADILLEWRNRTAINGILLYLTSIVFICYLSFNYQNNLINGATWNALFWIIILFSAVNAVAKSFIQVNPGRILYLYTISSPQGIILSKIIYNTLLLVFLGLVGFLFYLIVLGNPVGNISLFILNLILASIGFSSTLTMISGIAARANHSTVLMAILSFPVILPLLFMAMKISANSLVDLDISASYKELAVLFAINVIVITISYLLFPFLWRS
jgi:heme exporter protein B